MKWKGSMNLYCNNKSIISVTHNSIQHHHAKHVEGDQHIIKEKLGNGLICTSQVSIDGQLVDILIKV